MATVIKKYSLELVQESSKRYETDKFIKSSISAVSTFKEVFRLDKQCEEVLVMLCLDTKNKVTGAFEISRGSLNSSVAHPREIFKRAFSMNCARIMIAHNHPSGNAEPSEPDDNVTERMIEAGKLLGIELLDHIIIGVNSDEYMSYREEKTYMFKD